MKKPFLFMTLIALLSFAGAETVFIDPVSGDAGLAPTVQALMANTTEKLGYKVTTDRAAADRVLAGQLLSLGSSRMVTIRQLKDNATVSTAEGKTATVESLDSLVSLLVTEAFKGPQVQKKHVSEVGSIREDEVKQIERRKESRNYKSFGFGPSGLLNLESEELAYLFHVGYIWEVAEKAAVKVKNDYVFDFAGAFLMSLTLGANYYFTATNISPFAGFDFGYGLALPDDGDVRGGFALGGSLGLALFRTSTTQLMADVNYQALLKEGGPGKISLGISILH